MCESTWSWTSQNKPFQPPESVFQVRNPEEVFSLSRQTRASTLGTRFVSSELSGRLTWSHQTCSDLQILETSDQLADAALLQVEILVSHKGA